MGGWFIICYHISPYPIYMYIIYNYIYIYIMCVCFCHPSSPYIPALYRDLSYFGRLLDGEKPGWRGPTSDHPSERPTSVGRWGSGDRLFFGFGCWNLWWFYGILNHTTGRLLILRYMMLWCYISGASEKSIPTAIKLRKWRRKHQLLAVR